MDMVSSYGRHIYQVFSCGLHISCIERNWLPFSKCCITFDKSYDNFWRGNVFFRNLKDSCDGSGLNTSKSSKGSCPYFRYCWVVMLSNFHIIQYLGMECRRSRMVDPRFLPLRVWFFTTLPLVNSLSFGN